MVRPEEYWMIMEGESERDGGLVVAGWFEFDLSPCILYGLPGSSLI